MDGFTNQGVRMKCFAIAIAVALAATGHSSNADAAVLYAFTAGNGSFLYQSPTFVTGVTKLQGQTDLCVTNQANATCGTSMDSLVDNRGGVSDQVTFGFTQGSGSESFGIFSFGVNSFENLGSYTTPSGISLSVTNLSKPIYYYLYRSSIGSFVYLNDRFVTGTTSLVGKKATCYTPASNGVCGSSSDSFSDDFQFRSGPVLGDRVLFGYSANGMGPGIVAISYFDTNAFDTLGTHTSIMGSGATLLVGRLSPTAVAAVPEPASWAMMLGGFGLMGGVTRRRRKAGVRTALR